MARVSVDLSGRYCDFEISIAEEGNEGCAIEIISASGAIFVLQQ
jgi:hypothetical protein